MTDFVLNTKLAIPFKLNNEKINEKVSEFNIKFNKDSKLEKLIAFIQEYPDKRINVSFSEGVQVSILAAVTKVSDKVYARLQPSDLIKVDELREKECKFFFDAPFSANSFTQLEGFVNIGVSDLYISDDLCYNMKDVRGYCQEKNIGLRLVLNKIPATSVDAGFNLASPIYRPQDLDLLSQYYDMFEFACGEPYDWTTFDVLYRVWFENQSWHGPLHEINKDIHFIFPNDSVVPDFTSYKMNCGRRCAQRANQPCRKCHQFLELGWSLRDNNIRFKKEKNENHTGAV